MIATGSSAVVSEYQIDENYFWSSTTCPTSVSTTNRAFNWSWDPYTGLDFYWTWYYGGIHYRYGSGAGIGGGENSCCIYWVGNGFSWVIFWWADIDVSLNSSLYGLRNGTIYSSSTKWIKNNIRKKDFNKNYFNRLCEDINVYTYCLNIDENTICNCHKKEDKKCTCENDKKRKYHKKYMYDIGFIYEEIQNKLNNLDGNKSKFIDTFDCKYKKQFGSCEYCWKSENDLKNVATTNLQYYLLLGFKDLKYNILDPLENKIKV